jgi:hypothetical protein
MIVMHEHIDDQDFESSFSNLRRTRVDLPHVHLDSDYRYPGAEWWRRAVGSV